MIAAVLIRGYATGKVKSIKTLELLGLKKKFNMVFVDKDKEGMLKRVQSHIIFGEVPESFVDEIKKKFGEQKVYRLHPPVGGFKRGIRRLYPQGDAGKRADAEKMIRKMIA